MKTSEAGIKLIKTHEGLSLFPYECAVGVLSVGYGHTGTGIKPGVQITEEKADELLRKDLAKAEQAVDLNITVPLNQQQFDALVSFTYNCGPTALAESTLRKRLNNKEDPNKVAKEELPKWVNGQNGPLPGLVERRKAEIKLFTSGQPIEHQALIDIKSTVDTFLKKEPIPSGQLVPNQKARVKKDREYRGVQVIEKRDKHTRLVFPYNLGTWWVFDDHWYGLSGTLSTPLDKGEAGYDSLILNVPYQSQRDNYRDAGRTCFSSSCAMAAMYLKPGCMKSDNEYIQKVFQLGDTTDPYVHIRVLKSYGINATFRQDGNIEDLKFRIDNNIPCPVGILHKGPANAPSGGGHWICVIGYIEEKQKFIVHDPWGEIDNYSGEYISTNGNRLEYSYKLFRRRWTVEGIGTGWWLDLK